MKIPLKKHGALSEAQAHFEFDCQFREMMCPNGCGESLLRRDMPSHHNLECPNAKISCEFHKLGCTFEGTRSEINQHNMQNALAHVQLAGKEVSKAWSRAKKWEWTEIQWEIPKESFLELEVETSFQKYSRPHQTDQGFSLAFALSVIDSLVAISVCVIDPKVENITPLIRELQVDLIAYADMPISVCSAFHGEEKEMAKRIHGESVKWTVSVPLRCRNEQNLQMSINELIYLSTKPTDISKEPMKVKELIEFSLKESGAVVKLSISFWIRPKVECVLQGFDDSIMDAED
jgi:hypothetical protein